MTRCIRQTSIVLRVIASSLVWLGLWSPAFADPRFIVITVGGNGSAEGCDGIRLTGIQLSEYYRTNGIESESSAFGLPRLDVTRREEYAEQVARVEARVQESMRTALAVPQADVILMGYSHGATLALRVLHALADSGTILHRVLLVTVDRVGLEYPMEFRPDSLPVGLARALNIFQQVDSMSGTDRLFNHGRVRGSLEVEDVGHKLIEEYEKWLEWDQNKVFCSAFAPQALRDLFGNDPDSAGPHRYMQFSELVKREIFRWLGINYFGGLWEFHLSGAMRVYDYSYRRPPNYYNPIDTRRTFMLTDFLRKSGGGDNLAAMWGPYAIAPGLRFQGALADRNTMHLAHVTGSFGDDKGDDLCFRVEPIAADAVTTLPENLLHISTPSQRTFCQPGVYFDGTIEGSLLDLYRTSYLPTVLLLSLRRTELSLTGAPADRPVYVQFSKDGRDLGITGPHGRTNERGQWESSIRALASDAGVWEMRALVGDSEHHVWSEAIRFLIRP